MVVQNMNGKDERVTELEKYIRSRIIVPGILADNMWTSTTGLGGLFIHFASNTSNELAICNSSTRFTISFDTTNGSGKFEGTDIGLAFNWCCINRPCHGLRGIKKKINCDKVVDRVNKWLADNANDLACTIQY